MVVVGPCASASLTLDASLSTGYGARPETYEWTSEPVADCGLNTRTLVYCTSDMLSSKALTSLTASLHYLIKIKFYDWTSGPAADFWLNTGVNYLPG